MTDPARQAAEKWLAVRAHEEYLATCRKLRLPIRPEYDVPFDQLSDNGKALDLAFARIAVDFAERLALETLNYDAWQRGWPRLNEQRHNEMRERLPWAEAMKEGGDASPHSGS